jgi:hypothetical protein
MWFIRNKDLPFKSCATQPPSLRQTHICAPLVPERSLRRRNWPLHVWKQVRRFVTGRDLCSLRTQGSNYCISSALVMLDFWKSPAHLMVQFHETLARDTLSACLSHGAQLHLSPQSSTDINVTSLYWYYYCYWYFYHLCDTQHYYVLRTRMFY